mmetsp:Transcript_73598/g.204527  ORF Transcript_73598/g.204527 Transcript_73598/m.204527 type:complete len:1125 (+) Transcript_73598:84-3458(+)|eukprot:CAMPEP_0117466932 /NCGR_PEP_ID=MMETSP0784-20121206/5394_1 /TAXON_ID=39447 /ORGANISM="" /LENGTH=1124 /DNA_ID=CAMNT_0005260883 /DNA_START=42 /DNA_END=3416 /DNA_ORIENTATION=+
MMEARASRFAVEPHRTDQGQSVKKTERLDTKVYFHASYAEVSFGEVVVVVGDHEAIGAWDVSKGVTLTTNEDIFPCWISVEPISVELHAKVEYKYVVVSASGELRAWEEYTGNRQFVASGQEMTIEDDGGLYRQKTHNVETDDDDEQPGAIMRTKTPMVQQMDKDQRLAFVRELESRVTIDVNTTVFMVTLKLPIKVAKNEKGKFEVVASGPSDGRNFAFVPLMQELRKKTRARVVLVGWPGIHPDPRDRPQIERLLQQHDCIPVFPPQQEFEKYLSFCTNFLWPVFHDVMHHFQTTNPRPFDEKGWAAYSHMNIFFANTVVPHTHDSDLIWVHDYHLLMMPTFISKRYHMANIGFFLHTPFPSSDSFKSLPVREELLSGMLCADQVGFQFFTYARNFLVSVKRIYGLDPTFRAGGFMGIEYNGRPVMIKVAHFVYPFKDTQVALRSDDVLRKTAEVRKLFEGKTVFACMDRCDGLSGLLPKFRAFKRFLKEHEQFRGKAVLVQYVFGSPSGYMGEASLVEALQSQADAFLVRKDDGSLHIERNSKGGGGSEEPESLDIHLMFDKPEQPVQRTDRLALFKAADVLLDACVKDGLNLMPFEFITAHSDDEEQRSVVIVSEFSGCSRVLLGSLRINPWNASELVNACERALTMAPSERKERVESNTLYCSENSPMDWFEDFMADLRRARKKEGIRIENIGFGAKVRPVCVGQDFVKLPFGEVLRAYKQSKNRVFFLDNEGTLAADKRKVFRQYGVPTGHVDDLKSHGSAPNEQVIECLQTLCADNTHNTVVILSGRNREMLEEWFSDVKRIGLAAERGFYYKLPLATDDQWHCMVQNPDYTWKSYAFEIMRQFVKRTQGSFIENKGSALVWQYRDADQHFGSWQAKELSSHLKELLFGFDVEIDNGKGYVEVKLRGIHKGVAVTKVLSKVAQIVGEVDFVLCLGDDRSDEAMFDALNQFVDPSEEGKDNASQLSTTDGDSDSTSDRVNDAPDKVSSLHGGFASMAGAKKGFGKFSGSLSGDVSGGLAGLASGADDSASSGKLRRFFACTVGRKPSSARFYVDDTDEVSELLMSLKSAAERRSTKASPQEFLPSPHTWCGGGSFRKGYGMHGSMPALSSLEFRSSTK